ncbi:unnamed protein product [Rhizoctonia solani]|uniref:DUF1996 domain-containing protein n=1 Tax=Rhizoctonia solani TaxID=456999 RepID=A0A8H3B2C3_9AGAM|nr:unnamed protein product [Rhizoctonia solani]
MLSLSTALGIAWLAGSVHADFFRTHVDCSAFMRDMVDPIVSPGANATHLREYFLWLGCHLAHDQLFRRTPCWMHVLHTARPLILLATDIVYITNDGKNRVPVEVKLRAYYAGAPEYGGVKVDPIPQGARMVTGDAFATNSSVAEEVGVNWYCQGEEDGGKTKGQASWEFPDRCCKMWMKGNISFPQWIKQLEDGTWTWTRTARDGYLRIPYIRQDILEYSRTRN